MMLVLILAAMGVGKRMVSREGQGFVPFTSWIKQVLPLQKLRIVVVIGQIISQAVACL